MVLAGLRDGYPRNSQEYPSLKPASTISTDIPRNIPENIPPLARAIMVRLTEHFKSIQLEMLSVSLFRVQDSLTDHVEDFLNRLT